MSANQQEDLIQSMVAPRIYIERTLALIKPDVLHKAEEIEDIIRRSGFFIIQKRKVHLSPEQCSDFYSDQYGKMFFPSLTAYMSSGPILALELTRHNAILSWRELMGPSNSLKAKETHPDSLRAIFGTDDLRNAVHGSYCFTSAEREIRFMFPHVTIEPVPVGEAAKDYLNLFVNPTLLSGLTELCKQKPADPYGSRFINKQYIKCLPCLNEETPFSCIREPVHFANAKEIWLADWLLKHNPNRPDVQDETIIEE